VITPESGGGRGNDSSNSLVLALEASSPSACCRHHANFIGAASIGARISAGGSSACVNVGQ